MSQRQPCKGIEGTAFLLIDTVLMTPPRVSLNLYGRARPGYCLSDGVISLLNAIGLMNPGAGPEGCMPRCQDAKMPRNAKPTMERVHVTVCLLTQGVNNTLDDADTQNFEGVNEVWASSSRNAAKEGIVGEALTIAEMKPTIIADLIHINEASNSSKHSSPRPLKRRKNKPRKHHGQQSLPQAAAPTRHTGRVQIP